MTDQDLLAQLTPVQVVALTLYGEGRGGSFSLRRAIANVIANRAAAQHPSWGVTPREVCLKPAQFSCWAPRDGQANYETVMAAAHHLVRGERGGPILTECLAMATNLINDALLDATRGATFYFSPAAMVPKDRVPSWAEGKTPTVTVDGTQFYALAPDGEALA